MSIRKKCILAVHTSFSPCEYESTIDLERGHWTYIVLVPEWRYNGGGPEDLIEVQNDATQSFTEALRIARKWVGWKRVSYDRIGNPNGARPRKGLAYGLLIENSSGQTVTIIPTPRHIR